MLEQYNKVLSIQSHVVSGYVGNKSATFPLQVLGFEVDAINSVQFSNHTGYGYWKGQVLSDKDLSELIDGLKYNKLDYYTHLLTGYVGNPSFLAQIAELSKYLKSVNPNLIFVCDPVMGDNGEMYVPKELLPIYKNLIIPLADIITPNQYEVELLTGYCIKTIDDAWTAIENFHLRGVKTVVVSSTDLGNKDYLLGLGSSNIDGKNTKITVKIPKFPVNFTGTGDLFAALFLAWMHKTNNDLKISIEKTIATMQSVLNLTIKYSKDNSNKSSMGNMELKLIQSKNAIENPEVIIEAEVINKTTKECN